MRSRACLFIAAPALLVAATAAQRPAPGPERRAYVGSAACQRCHEDEHRTWSRSLHVQMTRPVADARVEGDFNDARLEQYGRSYKMERRDGRYFVSVARRNRPDETYEIHYTLGARRFQGYLSKLSDGRIYVLPVFWHNEYRRWVDWKEITPIPDGDHDLRQIWNVSCFNCHATNLARNFDVATTTYATTWTDMGIGCEACHGPGGEHVKWGEQNQKAEVGRQKAEGGGQKAEARDPLKPDGTIAQRPDPGAQRSLDSAIFNPRTAAPRDVFEACAYCHGNKVNYFTGFAPGDRYADYALPFLISQPIPPNDPQGDFWPDGRPDRFNRPQALMMSGCFRRGTITCTNCHAGHGSRNDHALKVAAYAQAAAGLPSRTDDASGRRISSQSDQLCTQCHKEPAGGGQRAAGGDWPAHSHHAAGSQGSRCIGCHMADLNWRLMTRRRDHTFLPPVPEATAAFGEPNACNTCHDDKSPEWAASVMDRWYGNGDRRRAALQIASVIYEAGAGTLEAIPGLTRIAVDRQLGAPMRASAVEFIGRLLDARQRAPAARTGTYSSGGTSGSQTALTGAAPVRAAPGGSKDPPYVRAGGDPKSGVPNRESRSTSRIPSPDSGVVNALIGAASDPEPIVRAAAAKALGVIGSAATADPAQPPASDQRIVMALFARLVDAARVVRVQAADALLHLSIVTAPGPAGAALARAQDEYAAHLASFPDDVDQHVALGWLELSRGRGDAAAQAFASAKRLDDRDARPWLFNGVLLARAGRYDDAIREWEGARRLDPTLPNLDRLIEEAKKRREKRP